MKKYFAWITAACLLFLCACASTPERPQQSEDQAAYRLYFASRDDQIESAVGSESCELPETGDQVEEMMDLLLAGPTSQELASPFPEGVALKNWSLEDGVLKLNLSEQYNRLAGIGLTIADYCITLTMCQLPSINTVIISVEGELISFRDHQTLRVSDVLLSASDEEDGNITVTLYFPRQDGKDLGSEQRNLTVGKGVTTSTAVVTALLAGPTGKGLVSLMPKDTGLLDVRLENGVCYVNFSAAFAASPLKDDPQGALLLYSVVNTLGSLSGVEKVQLLVEGETIPSFGGVSTLSPLKADNSLNS
ncbi:hypothetical protein SDC9_61296 [bioreactor metagenome]|uniref:GerMN domain-containing protein n=1 Tax=bioreactor metagenome TaxID=1076179 RepID=A0A644XFE5_9ZZZZ